MVILLALRKQKDQSLEDWSVIEASEVPFVMKKQSIKLSLELVILAQPFRLTLN